MSAPELTGDPYHDLPWEGPYDVEIGGALISMVEPRPGREVDYTRWYEDDHYYSGALAMPWMFAGRRYIATRDLQLLRYPDDSVIASPVTTGCCLHLYWITKGRVDQHIAWTKSTNARLTQDGRKFEDRTHIFTSFSDYLGGVVRDKDGPRDIHAIDVGYPGVLFEVIDANPGIEREDLDRWLAADYTEWVQRGPHSPVAQTLRFAPRPRGSDTESDVQDIPGGDRRITVVHFLDEDPRIRWMTLFSQHGHYVERSGLGRLQFCAPFIAAHPGTNRYVDQLR
jgi:hypothetical protein